MARIGRAQPNRPIYAYPPLGKTDAAITLPIWESLSEWPALTVTTPDARITLPIWETLSEWAALTVTKHQYPTLAIWETVSEWPALTVSVPVLPGDAMTGDPGQVELDGFLLGAGTPYKVSGITGWRSLPPVDNLNVEKPSSHGAWSARRLAKQRLVTIHFSMIDSITDPAQIDSLLDDLDQVTGLGRDDTPIYLVIKGYGAPQLAQGAVIDRDIPMDADYSNGSPSCSILIACHDPRRKSVVQHGENIPLGVETTLVNTGNADAHPIIAIPGPAENPVLTNASLARTLRYTATISDGATLEIDTYAGNATIGGVSVLSDVSGGGVPPQEFVLGAVNAITYTTLSGGTAGVDVLWRDSSH